MTETKEKEQLKEQQQPQEQQQEQHPAEQAEKSAQPVAPASKKVEAPSLISNALLSLSASKVPMNAA